MTESPSDWKNLCLSLERPYKDDNGNPIPTLLDIDPDGTFVYEEKESLDDRLKKNLHRIFQERGVDFFHNPDTRFIERINAQKDEQHEKDQKDAEAGGKDGADAPAKPMTFEELDAMRSQLHDALRVAHGEMTLTRDILNALLTTIQPNPNTVQSLLSGTTAPAAPVPEEESYSLSANVVSKPPPATQVQAVNAQIVIGSKDEALRKAASLFDTAAARLEKSQKRSEKYWVNALKIRRSNWRLIPSPLPPGSFVGKGADRTSKDFLVSYGLEESPLLFRRRAIASLSDLDGKDEILFASRPKTLMQITLKFKSATRGETVSMNTILGDLENPPVEDDLSRAQTEIIDQEIFSYLVKEASVMPTVLTRVSERSIVIDAAESIELRFDLLKQEDFQSLPVSPLCDVIYYALHVLLLRKHDYQKGERLNATASFGSVPIGSYSPPILQPIVDFLQYNLFCERLEVELNKAAQGLRAAGIGAVVTFTGVGDTGEELVRFLSKPKEPPISGEAVLMISESHNVRFTFVAPSNLTAHLSQATIHVYSMVQLSQLLTSEIETFLLQQISQLGQKLKGGTWLVDLDHLVARWDGCVLTFQLSFDKDLAINVSSFRMDNKTGRRGNLQQYSRSTTPHVSLLSWVEEIISKVL